MELTATELPQQNAVTGDKEIDAVLWLREVINTGQTAFIAKAMVAVKRIKTPLKILEERYLDHLVSKNPGNWTMVFQTLGFSDLEELAQGAVKKLTRKNEALARFDNIDNLHANTPAERFAIDALAGLKRKDFWCFEEKQVDARFNALPELMPNTLSDCLHELVYWDDLSCLRNAVSDDAGDHWPECQSRNDFVFRCLARIKPKTKPEAVAVAVAVFRWLTDSERMDDNETESILLNLIG